MNMGFKSSWPFLVEWSHGSEMGYHPHSQCDLGLGNRMRNQLSKCGLVVCSAAFLEPLHLPWVKHLP